MVMKIPSMPVGTKPFCLGALAGAVLVAWVGFDALGWKSSSTAESLSKRNAETAVSAALASICSEQFKKGPQYSAQLAALAKTERYSRGDIVAKGGWATMAGSKEPQPGVAQLCAELLIPPGKG
jgi:hypothetical protein